MSETIELTDRMSAADLLHLQNELAHEAGPRASVYIGAAHAGMRGNVLISIYPEGIISGRDSEFIYAETWPDAIRQARQWIANHNVTFRNGTIRRMALAIISLTDEHTVCRRADLVRQFSDAEVSAYEAEALARATEMAGNVPYVVVA